MRRKRGFTLLELLTTITILGVLMALVLNAFSRLSRSGQKAKLQELVAETATSLSYLIQEKKIWPNELIEASNGEGLLDQDACAALVNNGLMDLVSVTTKDGQVKTIGRDRMGLVDPFAADVLKRNRRATLDTPVPQGGTIKDHILHFAIDTDDSGTCTATVGGRKVKVRAAAIVWSAGADGKVEDTHMSGRSDDVFSWRVTQEINR